VGDVNPDNPPFAAAGTITLTACTTVTTTGTNFDDAVPTVTTGSCADPNPTSPAYVIFNPDGRWDRCGEIRIRGQKRDGDSQQGLDGWTIRLYGPNNLNNLLASQVTAGGGFYSFNNLAPGTYKVCEVLQANWQEQVPAAGASCTGANEAAIGYSIDTSQFLGQCCSGADISGKDFENVLRQAPPECPEDPNRAALMTRTVNTSKPLGGGGVAVLASELTPVLRPAQRRPRRPRPRCAREPTPATRRHPASRSRTRARAAPAARASRA